MMSKMSSTTLELPKSSGLKTLGDNSNKQEEIQTPSAEQRRSNCKKREARTPLNSGATIKDGLTPPKRPSISFSSLDPSTISLDPLKYDKPFPYFRRPKIVGSFSLDGDRRLHLDRRQLKFFHETKFKDKKSFSNAYKRITLDLNEGMANVTRKPAIAKNEKLDKLLEWILKNKASFSVDGNDGADIRTLSTDFVCFRGLMTTLMCTPYERRENWEFIALKFKARQAVTRLNHYSRERHSRI